MKKLTNYIQSLIDINNNDLSIILSHFTKRTLGKGSYILQHGQLASFYYYIDSGALRIFSNENPNEKTLWIAFENEFIADLPSLKLKIPSHFSYQAIEDTILYIIESEKMEQLYIKFPQWQAFGRQIWEKAFLSILDNIILLQTQNATERYKKAVLSTEFIQRVPLKYLSSFLGITQTSLSRIRKNIK